MKSKSKPRTARQKLLMLLTSVLTVVALSFILPFSGLLITDTAQAQDKPVAQGITDAQKGFGSDVNPRSNFWRAVREGNAGYSAIKGVDSNVLIQSGGENWRAVRNGPVFYWGWIAFAVVVVVLALFWLLRGRIKLDKGRSGIKIKRWGSVSRLLHWVTAVTFILLSATGLSLLYGKAVFIPWVGKDAFAAWAFIAKNIHNYTGPVFSFTLVVLLLMLIKDNIPNGTDLKWFAKGGGIIGKGHPSAGRMNGGEKVWFWLLATFGIASVLSGLAMNFLLELTRYESQLAMSVHAIASIVVMVVSLGHIYIGTAGTEGALEGMTTGEVDLNWARQHHDIWLEDLQRKGKLPEPVSSPPNGATAAVGD